MYRNAVLRTLNRRLFSNILQTLFEETRAANINPYMANGILNAHQLQLLIKAVIKGYQTALYYSGYTKSSKPSNTLITKILMGVMCVLPAFDSCFRAAITDFNIHAPKNCQLSDKLDKTSLTVLLNLVQDIKVQKYLRTIFDGVIEIAEKDHSGKITQRLVPYPPMRLLDLYFWVYGMGLKKLIRYRK